ncbi:MAG: hypothetical protein FJ118_01115 [Deltaproteobacteria bacterium]|nr:hypothetical protein [Deltaproteobacteria bacterium]
MLKSLVGDGIRPSLTRLLQRDNRRGAYSRRINIQHRLVYQVIEEDHVVKVIRMWTHYD